MVRKIEHTPEELAKARHLYEKTLAPVSDIMAMLGISRCVFYQRVRKWGWERRRAAAGTYEFARAVTEAMAQPAHDQETTDKPAASGAPAPVSDRAATTAAEREEARAAFAARIQRIAEREMDAVERVLDALGPSGQAEADRCARTLAGIARTLREITAMNQPKDVIPADETDDDTIPIDLDDLRCALARELDALIEARFGTENSGSVGTDTQQEPRNT